jgi:hypothetical protein
MGKRNAGAGVTRRRIVQGVAGLAANAGLGGLGVVRAQTTTLPEVQVSTAPIPDYEFDRTRNGVDCPSCNFGAGTSRLAFVDLGGNCWVGGVDYQTGAFVPADGKGVLIDTNCALSTDFGNGPEWVDGASGSSLVYTKYMVPHVPGDPADQVNAALGWAQMVNGTWSASVLPNSLGRASPAGSLDPKDKAPRIHYVSSKKGQMYWRKLAQPGTEHKMTALEPLTEGNARRWIPGTRKLIVQGKLPGSDARLKDQVLSYDTDTNLVEVLTDDPEGKRGCAMWRAPEFGNEYVFITMPQFRQSIQVFRLVTGADDVPRWTLVKTIAMPQALPYVWSPEAFVHNGRSYVFFQISSSSKFWDLRVPTQIAMSGIDPLRNDFRMLTNNSAKPRVRLDPEYFITAKGPYIYYTRLVPETDSNPPFNDGVWRVDTKLGPPKV